MQVNIPGFSVMIYFQFVNGKNYVRLEIITASFTEMEIIASA